jgi:hypothetical protein
MADAGDQTHGNFTPKGALPVFHKPAHGWKCMPGTIDGIRGAAPPRLVLIGMHPEDLETGDKPHGILQTKKKEGRPDGQPFNRGDGGT